MKFDKCEVVDSICYQMRLGDYPRGQNRALINNLFNGAPPILPADAEVNGDVINVNFLESTRLGHDARSQFSQAFQKPGNYFVCSTDAGIARNRMRYGHIVTKEMNRLMKRSIPYMEVLRSKFALDVLHGIAPTAWRDQYRWRPDALGVEDAYVPSGTLLTMVNLPFFAIRKTFTAPELIRLTRDDGDRKFDPGWNKTLVDNCIKWIDSETHSLMSTNWPDIWSPEKVNERIKGDGGFYSTDSAATISVFDFYFWSDEGGKQGWRRRMILDCWATPTGTDASAMTRKAGDIFTGKSANFLYNSKERIFSPDLARIINWQFADLSAVAPFRYHSVRSLGFLLYAVCHLQNRMRCKFNESVFEQMLVYFRVKNADDAQRAMNVDLINRGFIDENLEFVKRADRYEVNAALVQLGLSENSNLIAANSSSYTSQPQGGNRSNVERTKFEVMAEVQAMTSLVSTALGQAYVYQKPEYREIFRRFVIEDSKDPDVRTFQANCLRQGVPSKILYNPECWEQEPERVLGAGNKTMEMAIAQQLMEFRNLYDPESQRTILRDVTLAITDDPARADALVPETVARITDSVHDAQLSAGVLMQGLPVAVKSGMNHIEYIDTLLHTLAGVIQQGATQMSRVIGMQMMGQNIAEHIKILSQDPEEKQRVRAYNDQLGALMNAVKQLGQQLQQQQGEAGGNAEGMAQESQAKVQAMLIQAKAKAESGATSHAQKTAQRQIQFEMEEKRKQQQFQLDMQRQQMEARQAVKVEGVEIQHGAVARNLEAAHEASVRRAEREEELEHTRKMNKAKIEAVKKQAAIKARAASAAAKKKPAAKK